MINVLFTSDYEDIKEVSRMYNVTIDEDKIIFTTKIDTTFSYDVVYEIARFYPIEKRGILRTKTGIKEYKSLKALYNAVWKLFDFNIGVDYNKVLELKKNIINSIEESIVSDNKEEVKEETKTDNKEEVIYAPEQLIKVVKAEQNSNNLNIARCIINMYNQSRNFYQDDMIDCMNNFIKSGILDFTKYNIEF